MRKPLLWLALLGLGLITTAAQAQWTWSPAASLHVTRQRHSATLLSDGRVLVAGGAYDFWGESVRATCEIYDPTTDTWDTAANMTTPRSSHTATLLPDGKVFVTGGYPGTGYALSSCEIYDPSTDTWDTAAPMSVPRYRHLAIALNDDSLLIVGGRRGNADGTTTMHLWGPVSSCEIYRISTNTWFTAASMHEPRVECAASRLPDGRILVSGGIHDSDDIGNWAQPATNTCEIYDPVTDTWTLTDTLATARNFVRTVTLDDNTILTVGGELNRGALSSCQTYDPSTDTWGTTSSMHAPRITAEVLKMSDGNVMTIGGWDYLWTSQTNTTELYDVYSGTWNALAPMNVDRGFHSATLLSTGDILVVGGTGTGGSALSSCEIFHDTTTAFRISAVSDNPDDDGNYVRVYWNGHANDRAGAGDAKVTSYSIYLEDDSKGTAIPGLPEGLWTKVSQAPAQGHRRYSLVVPTQATATSKAQAYSTFVVVANTASTTYSTPPVSGQAFDNRGPARIPNLNVTTSDNGVLLEWTRSSSPDAATYAVYRGTMPNFPMVPATQIATTATFNYTDISALAGKNYYYRVRAVDVYQNDGTATPPVSAKGTASVAADMNAAEGVVIGQNYPQPFSTMTTIPVALSTPTSVSVQVFDNLARLVKELPATTMPSGQQQIHLDASELPSGNYVCTVHAGSAVRTLPLLIAR